MKTFRKARRVLDFHAGNLLTAGLEMGKKRQQTMKRFSAQFLTVLVACLLITVTAAPVFAAGDVNANDIMTNVLSIVVSMFRYVGIMLLVWGVCQFVLAIKRTDAESKSDAIQTIMCAIALIAIKTLVNALGLGIETNDNAFGN